MLQQRQSSRPRLSHARGSKRGMFGESEPSQDARQYLLTRKSWYLRPRDFGVMMEPGRRPRSRSERGDAVETGFGESRAGAD